MKTYTRWDGRVFTHTDEYELITLGGRNVAMRNRKQVLRPVYRCQETGEMFVMMTDPPPTLDENAYTEALTDGQGAIR